MLFGPFSIRYRIDLAHLQVLFKSMIKALNAGRYFMSARIKKFDLKYIEQNAHFLNSEVK